MASASVDVSVPAGGSAVFQDSSTGQVETVKDAGPLLGSLFSNEMIVLEYESY